MTKLRLLILYVFLTSISIAQTKIHLKAPKYINEWESYRGDYEFVNILDTAYLKVGHQEDMGTQYGHYYELKPNVPNGEYLIFVDDTMRLQAFVKNFNKDSTWTNYFGNGKSAYTSQYKNGKLNGESIAYYENGSIRSKGKYLNNIPVGTATTFYKSGTIESKCYYDNGTKVKEEVFDKNGKLIHVYGSKAIKTIKK